MAVRVSIILPVHNAGRYLSACLESLLGQTCREWELLLVEDCPTDGSDAVCRTYAARDNRIRVVTNPANLHIGASRNRGLELARGQYIAFCDHDDLCAPDMLERLLATAEAAKADVVFSAITSPEEPSWEAALTDILTQAGQSDFNLVLGALYRRETIDNVRFVDTHRYSAEDKIFNIQVLLQQPRVAWLSSPLYTHRFHRHNEGSRVSYLFTKRCASAELLWEQAAAWEPRWRNALLIGLYKQCLNLLSGALLQHPWLYCRMRAYLRRAAWAQAAIKEVYIPKKGLRELFQRFLLWQLR